MANDYNVLEKGAYFEMKFVKPEDRTSDGSPHFKPLFKEWDNNEKKFTGVENVTSNVYVDKALIGQILSDTTEKGDKCKFQISMWVKEGTTDTFKVNMRPFFEAKKKDDSFQAKKPIVKSDDIDDSIPF